MPAEDSQPKAPSPWLRLSGASGGERRNWRVGPINEPDILPIVDLVRLEQAAITTASFTFSDLFSEVSGIADQAGMDRREDMMAEPTREEFDAKLATVEAHSDARFEEIRGDIKVLTSGVTALTNEVSESRKETRQENKFTRVTLIVTGIAVVIGLWAAMVETQSGLLTAFQTGLSVIQAPSQPAKPPSDQ